MTVKGKRSQHLAKMSQAEADELAMGGMVDESVPSETISRVLAAEDIDIAAFELFLGPTLGRYRDISQSTPAVADEIRLIDLAIAAAEQAGLRLTNLPPSADAYANHNTWKLQGEHYIELSQRISKDLMMARVVLNQAAADMSDHSNEPGRKPGAMRDRLLADVADWLIEHGVKGVEKAAGYAASILAAANVYVPCDPKEARKRVLAAKREK